MRKSLKAWFKTSQWSQNKLALALGINRSAITHWLNGSAKPATKHLKRLSEITGIPVEELL
jgi:transcriptional regulator with XRE-family HTH domain